MKKAAVTTLGCKVNQYEGEAMAEAFAKKGYEVVSFAEKADYYVIHTCAVTASAERKSRRMIRRAYRHNPEAFIIVTGCYPQADQEAVKKLLGVDLIMGTKGRHRIVEEAEKLDKKETTKILVASVKESDAYQDLPNTAFKDRTRAFLKIQEGCDRYCAYCVIPYVRGPIRSRKESEVLKEALSLRDAGYREIVLTGINLGLYGKDLDDKEGLIKVLHRLHGIEGIQRIRLSSIEPTEITTALLDTMASLSKMAHHLHIPLQSGDDVILSRMKRLYRGEDIIRLAEDIRKRLPQIGLSTDVIVGFPGEKEHHFGNTCRVVCEAAFNRVHIFPFSPRPMTEASKLAGRVDQAVKEERSRRLNAQAKEQALSFHRRLVGRNESVLAEPPAEKTNRQAGWTSAYVRAVWPEGEKDLKGQLVDIHIVDADEEKVYGRLKKISKL